MEKKREKSKVGKKKGNQFWKKKKEKKRGKVGKKNKKKGKNTVDYCCNPQ